MVYMDDGHDVFKLAIPAEDENRALEYANGNGNVIAVRDVTEDFPIDLGKVVDALRAARFGLDEIDFIQRCLLFNGIAE